MLLLVFVREGGAHSEPQWAVLEDTTNVLLLRYASATPRNVWEIICSCLKCPGNRPVYNNKGKSHQRETERCLPNARIKSNDVLKLWDDNDLQWGRINPALARQFGSRSYEAYNDSPAPAGSLHGCWGPILPMLVSENAFRAISNKCTFKEME